MLFGWKQPEVNDPLLAVPWMLQVKPHHLLCSTSTCIGSVLKHPHVWLKKKDACIESICSGTECPLISPVVACETSAELLEIFPCKEAFNLAAMVDDPIQNFFPDFGVCRGMQVVGNGVKLA